jgi:hypothetical protein
MGTQTVFLLGILSLGQLSDFDKSLGHFEKCSDIILIRKTTENKTQF